MWSNDSLANWKEPDLVRNTIYNNQTLNEIVTSAYRGAQVLNYYTRIAQIGDTYVSQPNRTLHAILHRLASIIDKHIELMLWKTSWRTTSGKEDSLRNSMSNHYYNQGTEQRILVISTTQALPQLQASIKSVALGKGYPITKEIDLKPIIGTEGMIYEINDRLFIAGLDIRVPMVYKLLTLIPAFNKIENIKDLDMQFLNAVADGDHLKISKLLVEIYDNPAERIAKARKTLIEAVQSGHKQTILTKEKTIVDYKQRIESMFTKINDHYRQMDKAAAELQGLLGAQLSEENTEKLVNETLDFIEQNEYLSLLNASEGTIVIQIKAPLIFFEEDLAKKLTKSTAYNIEGKAIIKTLFVEKKATVWSQTVVSIDLVHQSFHSDGNYIDNSIMYRHPHLMRFNCWGNNERQILEALRAGDMVLTFNMIIGATMNLNLGDSTVLGTFLNTISNDKTVKSFKLNNTGDFMSYTELKNALAPPPEPVVINVPDPFETIENIMNEEN